jgi:hypothetical protein
MSEAIDDLWAEICAESQRFYERCHTAAERFAASIRHLDPRDPRLVKWLRERVWSEREGAMTHAYAVVKLGHVLDPDALADMARQSMDEAHHFTYVEPCLRARGASLADYEPRPGWQQVFAKNYAVVDTLDPVRVFAVFHMGGEGPASATASVFARAFVVTPNADISEAYQRIAPDEAWHWAHGRKALRVLLQSPAEAARALEALRASGDVLFGQYASSTTRAPG